MIVYGDQNDVWARIYDTTSGTLSGEVQVDRDFPAGSDFALNPQVSAVPGAGFIVTWADWNGSNYDVRARLFSGSGSAAGSDFVVTSLTDNSQFMPAVAVSGYNVLFAWEDYAPRPEDGTPSGIRGRTFAIADPDLSVTSNGTVNEGTPPGAGGDLVFTITRTDTSGAENVSYMLSGTATAGTDYTAVSGIASFAAGQNTVQVHVSINADSTIELDETVEIALVHNPAATATATINNDDFVVITGTKKKDVVDGAQTVAGQPLPSDLDDHISGLGNKDRLSGLGGDDVIDGGKHKDRLFGGAGGDTFVFSASHKEKPDKIGDFVALDDTIELLQKKFKKLDLGVLSDDAFRDIGEKATSETRITYKANGELSYDKDGKGGADAIVFAKLTTKPGIDASDFLVVG